MLIRVLSLILFLAFTSRVEAQVKVRLFYGVHTESAIVKVNSPSHTLVLDGKEKIQVDIGDIILISRAGNKIAVNSRSGLGFLADNILILSEDNDSYIRLDLAGDRERGGDYTGNMVFSSSLGILKIVNEISMQKYIAGVVQAEGGYKGHLEYFKSQAIIARTYALLHFDRHADEGYMLCDDVHCQVYHGKSIIENIDEAVKLTEEMVLADNDSLLILTPFHSNCGGQTVSSGDVWLTSLPYLESLIDPYCSFSRNANWEMSVDRGKWYAYVSEMGEEEISKQVNFDFLQLSRLRNYTLGTIGIPLKSIRSDWKLRSTLFSIKDNGDELLLSGRGYGHGVGLCQEGAMVMANRGFNFRQILNFYYKNVKLLSINNVKEEKPKEISF